MAGLCDAIVDGRVTNSDASFDEVFANVTSSCADYLTFLDDNGIDRPDEDVSFACLVLDFHVLFKVILSLPYLKIWSTFRLEESQFGLWPIIPHSLGPQNFELPGLTNY